ncbi:MAG: methylmalonyl-CoA mutase family protein, partial [Chloroflexi bacterium]|nr:methylmalonyl-CoA mutase family protein [Chloroflexota bacterium]
MSENGNGNLEQLAFEQENWENKVLKRTLERSPEREESFRTSSVEVKRFYTPLDGLKSDYVKDVGFPGAYPFTRGVQPTMYRGRLWSMRQYAGFGTPDESNERFRFLLQQGQTGLSVAFDLPTQLGYDSDHEMASGAVGKVGVAINSLRDMEIMFNGIPLNKVSTSMTINAPASVMLAFYVAVAEKQGVSLKDLDGTTQNDVLKEYVARGTYIFPPRPSLRLAADLIAYCSQNVPKWNTISLSGYHIRDAGSTAVQEIAFSFANAIAYIDATLERGVPVDEFAGRLSWIFNTHNNFFEEVAKYRALRRMWAKLMRERYGAKDSRSWMFRTHTQTGGSTLTAQQPEVNIARAAIQALAAVLGGVQSMALSCYDEALALPTEKAQRIALRTQQVIAYETGAADTIDPLAGSYLVEALTDELEARAWELIAKIEEMGGAVVSIENTWMQQQIADAAYTFQRDVDEGRRVVVGVNRFTETDDEVKTPIFRTDPRVAATQAARLADLRQTRDNAAVAATLERLRE